ncbi:MAG: hypothetical protein KC420_10840, partial [Myxococcales bacterium]|nr:hypothetical protein [Myxococcales bacterium]
MTSPWRGRGRLGLGLLALGLLAAALIMVLPREPEDRRVAGPEPATAPRQETLPTRRVDRDAPECALEGAACHEGDVWLMDRCGVARELLERCEGGCEEGSCRDLAATDGEVADPCEGLVEQGVCEGDVAVGCAGGVPFRIECGAAGKRCVMTSEGGLCRAPSADDCDGEAPRCEEDRLRYCHDGRWQTLECRGLGARCDDAAGRCVLVEPAAVGDECGACGCPAGPVGDEVCDGRDNDGDGEVDEGVACDPVPVIFFILGDRPRASREALEASLARVNQIFAGAGEGEGGLGLRFTLLDVIPIERSAWVNPDEAARAAMMRAEALHPKRDVFYVPVALVGALDIGDVPKAGLATVPNGVCGGRRRGAANQLPVGLVILADRRSSTTLAHELGHFLGLCHTHEGDADVVQRVVVDPEGEALACDEACRAEGDGICDTPPDPGVESCAVDRACAVTCPKGQKPDPHNIMSYYTRCRERLSAEQLALARTSLWLRRGWHSCFTGPPEESCPCTPGLGECPEGMSCWPHAGGASCWLDGPIPPGGGPCSQHLECSRESLCVTRGATSTCARACLVSGPGCTC